MAKRRANEAHITPATMPALKEALKDEPAYGTPWNTKNLYIRNIYINTQQFI